jgi:hypothetical protein
MKSKPEPFHKSGVDVERPGSSPTKLTDPLVGDLIGSDVDKGDGHTHLPTDLERWNVVVVVRQEDQLVGGSFEGSLDQHHGGMHVRSLFVVAEQRALAVAASTFARLMPSLLVEGNPRHTLQRVEGPLLPGPHFGLSLILGSGVGRREVVSVEEGRSCHGRDRGEEASEVDVVRTDPVFQPVIQVRAVHEKDRRRQW